MSHERVGYVVCSHLSSGIKDQVHNKADGRGLICQTDFVLLQRNTLLLMRTHSFVIHREYLNFHQMHFSFVSSYHNPDMTEIVLKWTFNLLYLKPLKTQL